ncbi:hypothetical protein [Phaeospirillum tilakii]|uniref:Uncharacterized protein n=1 Tax=Phaeospirillum tilakii TaxID=741673 RepID=A0ABW5C973_9PROT
MGKLPLERITPQTKGFQGPYGPWRVRAEPAFPFVLLLHDELGIEIGDGGGLGAGLGEGD